MPEALSEDQDKSRQAVFDWFNSRDKSQFFKLFGYAGTGKTTLAKVIAEDIGDGVLFAAYTGKAAQVLRRKTGRVATTIHYLVYQYQGKDKKGNPIFDTKMNIGEGSALASARLLIVDECSMINQDVMDDLIEWGCPILAIGDPAQLPPVKGLQFFNGSPDTRLDNIHRQEEGNPIIELATKVRREEKHNGIANKDSRLTYIKTDPTDDTFIAADQILCGKNETRHAINHKVRKILGYEGLFPEIGERVVCLKNNRSKDIFNGETFEVIGIDNGYMTVMSDWGHVAQVNPDPRPFTTGVVEYTPAYDLFDFGYCLTVNKAQGSEWDNVVLIDDRLMANRKTFRRQWLYTAVTRAAKNLTIIKGA